MKKVEGPLDVQACLARELVSAPSGLEDLLWGNGFLRGRGKRKLLSKSAHAASMH